MTTTPQSKRLYVFAGLAALLLAPIGGVLAAPRECITPETRCDYDLLCAFKVELAEKMFLFETFVANSPTTKAAKGRTVDGVTYKGDLYDAALREAKRAEPNAEGDDLAAAAYDKFADKVRAKLRAEAGRYRECNSLGVQPNDTLRGTWSGMRTSKKDCFVYGNPPDNETVGILLDDLKRSSEGCLEIWDSDRGHEAVHEAVCRTRLADRERPPLTLKDYVDEDAEAYRYNVQRAVEDLSRMQIRCTADSRADRFRKRADQLLKKASRYQAKQANQGGK